MNDKIHAEWVANLEKVTQKKLIEKRLRIVKGITSSRTLGEIQVLVNALIAEHGVSAKIDFDSGDNNINESLILTREETNEEVNLRIDKEIEALMFKGIAAQQEQSKISEECSTISKNIQDLIQAKH